MVFNRLKKALISLALSIFVLSSGVIGSSVALAGVGHLGGQDPYWQRDRRPDRWERERARRDEREEINRIRELDRDRRVRYRMNNRIRIAGYYDRWGNFHQYGYYDRFGIFHRY